MTRPCVGYLRVSTERQVGEDKTSLADQQRAIEALATTLGLTVERWYKDEGASGATVEKRPALRQLIADIEANPRSQKAPGYVLVLNDSRWGRFPDPEDATYWRRHLGHRGWIVRFAEHDDTDNKQLRGMMRAMVQGAATQKRDDVKANAKRGSRGTASLGYWGTREPYGFRRAVVSPAGRERTLAQGQRKAPDEKVKLVPHRAEAKVIRALFTRYATGQESIASVTAWLREAAPARNWTRAAVKFTLANPAYVGDVVSGRYSPEDRERHQESEWIVTRDAHEAIVPRAIFHRCRDILARNAKWTTRVRTDWIVSGLVQCPCGKPYVAGGGNKDRRGKPVLSYRCASKSGLRADCCPHRGAVKKDWLEYAVVETVASIVGGPSQRKRLAAILDRVLNETRPGDQLGELTAQLTDAVSARDRLVDAVATGTLTAEEAKSRLADVRQRIARLEAQRDALQPANASALRSERDALLAGLTDFRAAAYTLKGPALREHLRPWIQSAVFDPKTRKLDLAIPHIPVSSALASMPWPSGQSKGVPCNVTRRVVTVGAPR